MCLLGYHFIYTRSHISGLESNFLRAEEQRISNEQTIQHLNELLGQVREEKNLAEAKCGGSRRRVNHPGVAPSDGTPPAQVVRAEEVKPSNQEQNLNTRSLLLTGGDQEKVESLLYRFDQPTNLTHEMLTVWGGHGYDADRPGEEGYVGKLERLSYNNKVSFYNRELKHHEVYTRSPVPKNSWSVKLPNGKMITMDEIVYGYDLWFEENQMFNQINWMGVLSQQDPTDGFVG